MSGPRAVIVPFGVPNESRGLGLGLAALVHSFAQIQGESVALAQLHAKKPDDSGGMMPSPVEAFVPPLAWRDLAGAGNAPHEVSMVVTGAFEPPSEGRGMIQLLAFDPRDGTTRAKVEHHLDDARAGASLLVALDEFCKSIGGELGNARQIGDLGWDALESVLLAERCALHDPTRGGPHDRLAALVHLGRAVDEAPTSAFPVGRLATFALEIALTSSIDPRMAESALRALTHAAEDAPGRLDLLEAIAALHVRLGAFARAEAQALDAIAALTPTEAPRRGRLYAVLSESRRARGDLAGAAAAIDVGLAHAPQDPLLTVERGTLCLEQGDLDRAEAHFRDVLSREPLMLPAFLSLATIALKKSDGRAAEMLVDRTLATHGAAHPEALRRSIHLSLALEADGVARAARIASLARALIAQTPADPWASLVLARALGQMGERAAAAERLRAVCDLAPTSAIAAEARRARFAIEEPAASQEMDGILRAAYTAQLDDLDQIATRGRRFAGEHAMWPAWFAVGIAERRRARWAASRSALEETIALADGCTPAHMELVAVCITLGDPAAALAHAERALKLEGETSRCLAVKATALLALGRLEDAQDAIDRSLKLDPNDVANRALEGRIRAQREERDAPMLTRASRSIVKFFRRE